MSEGPFEAGPRCPNCNERKLRMRPFVTGRASCFGCGTQFDVGAGQEQRVRDAEDRRREQTCTLQSSNATAEFVGDEIVLRVNGIVVQRRKIA